ncbi:hypothetical protein [Leeuwenhoekiella parthenopeia]|uniref:Uncharacterized protein n=1 Tax=Leeuwenhoekiella parthenopeia TaxID=2890320 RepID=A0ABS8H0Q1_9FLAO|nr:hypothetical protein [Leeuwenhoekiella parthenopeia]MCC4214388.1 hypothetical protein [Leeuwenhoekiella parthenopeia]
MDKENAHIIVAVLFHLKAIQVAGHSLKNAAFTDLAELHSHLEESVAAILASATETEAQSNFQQLATQVNHMLKELNQLQKLADPLKHIQLLLKPYDLNTGTYVQNNS